MKISRIDVDSFGAWRALQIGELSQGLNVFYGPNEAGKTTLLEFLRSAFYGLTGPRRHYLPAAGEPCGGSLEITAARGPLRLERYFDSRSLDDQGSARVLDRSGRQLEPQALPEALYNVEEGVYSRVFAVGLRELQELGALNDAGAARLLYETTLGLEGVSLAEVMDALQASRLQAWGSPGENSTVAGLAGRRDRIRRELRRHGRGGARYGQLRARLRDLQTELEDLAVQGRRLESEATIVEAASGVQEKWRRRGALRAQAASLRGDREFPSDGAARMASLRKRYDAARRERQLWKRRGMAVSRRLRQIGFQEALWDQAPRIQALAEQKSYLEGVERTLDKLREEAQHLHGEVAGGLERLGVRTSQVDGDPAPLASQSMTPLREAAQAIQAAEKELRLREEELVVARGKSAKLGEQIRRSLTVHGGGELEISLEKAGERVAQLRNRRQTDERLAKLNEKHRALSDESRRLAEDRQIPLQTYIFAGLVFALGAGGVLGWLASFWNEELLEFIPQLNLVGGAGLLVCFGTVWMLSWWEREAAEESDKCLQQLDLCEEQVAKLERERKELDAWLPRDGGPLSNRLASAEKELEELERILPLEAEHQAAREAEELAGRRVPQAKEDLEAARELFKETAAGLGLPASLQPDHLHDLSQRREEVTELQRSLQRRRDDLKLRATEFEAALARIDAIVAECGIELEPGLDWQEKIDRLAAEIRGQEGLRKEHRALERRLASARGKFDRVGRTVLRLTARRRALLHEAGARDGKHFRRMAEQAAEADRMFAEAEALDREILEATSAKASQQQLAELLDASPPRDLDGDWSRLTEEIEAVDARTRQIHEERGRATQQIEAATQQDDAAKLRYELALVEAELDQALENWQVRTLASLWFDDLRSRYEEKRQPQTLIDGSRYFSRMTAGKYDRVWTKLSEHTLRVDDAEGTTWNVEQLSSGCREQLFLALRMALVDSYAASGVHLPVVLDDVLVNFDDVRAAAAAETIRDFAAGERQVFVFTCHEHVTKIFERLGVNVRRLGAAPRVPEAPPEVMKTEEPEAVESTPEESTYVSLPVVEIEAVETPVAELQPLETQLLEDQVAEPEPPAPESKPRSPRKRRRKKRPVAEQPPRELPAPAPRERVEEPASLEPAPWVSEENLEPEYVGPAASAARRTRYVAATTDYGPIALRELAEAIDDDPSDDWLEESALER